MSLEVPLEADVNGKGMKRSMEIKKKKKKKKKSCISVLCHLIGCLRHVAVSDYLQARSFTVFPLLSLRGSIEE